MVVQYILIVENDRINRAKVSASLQNDGFCVQYVNNTESALKLLVESRPFLILIDLIKSKLSAETFSSILKNDEDTCDIKIIAFSDKESDKLHRNFDSIIYTKGNEEILINGIRTYLTKMTSIISTITFLENKS